MLHHTVVRIRGYHADAYGHVNNARYLEFFEEARWALFDRDGLSALLADAAVAVMPVRIDIRYRQGAYPGDVLQISSIFQEVKKRSAVMEQTAVFADTGKMAASAAVYFMAADRYTHKLMSFPPELYGAMLAQIPAGQPLAL